MRSTLISHENYSIFTLDNLSLDIYNHVSSWFLHLLSSSTKATSHYTVQKQNIILCEIQNSF